MALLSCVLDVRKSAALSFAVTHDQAIFKTMLGIGKAYACW
jgi:hypothetical protein